ncbi:hypothetical protein QNI19_31545 [Cytophagaceae bacterium DM2B3-1]|uniref:Secreted protein n=1 Tax=Xanthocytophaga flava TaxID=3048013 RepID=A0ABT7CV28_9BACT|nr:hypothetical protein [Xanthocytophaga flavus]MDJ1469228.1 hypothetical protein [Xanthocytophaga flavus]MDJ1497516.1 hypothetical protein [Xanthocytophaga flavus]
MLRKLLIPLLLFSLMLQSFSRVGIVASFYINQKVIANTVCINKTKPYLKCNGKCYLAKKLKKAEEQHQRNTSAIKRQSLILFYTPLFIYSTYHFATQYTRSVVMYYLLTVCGSYTFDVFQPPQ